MQTHTKSKNNLEETFRGNWCALPREHQRQETTHRGYQKMGGMAQGEERAMIQGPYLHDDLNIYSKRVCVGVSPPRLLAALANNS